MTRLIILCLAWMALSAATAYYADIAGRWLGKRRKTMFGWRPKRTAAVIITGAGALIALLSFLILLVADAGIRRALLHWDQTVQQLDQAKAETQVLALETKALRAGTEAQKREIIQAQADLRRSQAAVARARVALDAAEANVAVRQSELAGVQASLGSARSSLGKVTGQLTATHDQLSDAKSDLRRAATDLAARRKEVQKAERVVFEAGAQSLRVWNQAYAAQRVANQALSGQLVARRDEELARSVIPPLTSLSTAREELATTLNKARALISERTHERGVTYPANAKYVKVTRKILRVESAHKGRVEEYELPEQTIRDAVANSLLVGQSPPPGGVVLQVVARANTVAGETVPVDFRLFENHLIFEKGDTVGTVVINASESKEDIIRHITGMLTEVRQAAIEKGLMPASDNSVSSLSLTQIADAYNTVLDRIQVYRQARVPVDVVVVNDAWTAGPLNLKLSVRTYYDGQ